MQPEVQFRAATLQDLDPIVAMLADDPLGKERETYANPLPSSYLEAFEAIANDPNQLLTVAVLDDEVVGVLQLTFIPYLTYRGSWRALVEGVRVHAQHRSLGLGTLMLEWAIERAREKGCRLVQLTTDKARPKAATFYEDLGFVASHTGMKLHLQ